MSSTITLPDCPSLTHHQVTLPTNVSLHYADTHSSTSLSKPPKEGKVILLVHGWPDCWYGWRKQIPVLYRAGYRIIAVDIRGMGETCVLPSSSDSDSSIDMERDLTEYTFKRVNEDITALLNYLNIPKIIILGHDWGGAVVWHYSRRYPWRTHAVGAFCTPYRPRSSQYIPIEQIVQKFPAFRYQMYLGQHSDTATREIQQQIPRFIGIMYRTSQRDDYVGKWMRSEYTQLLEGYPQEIRRSKLLNDREYQDYINVFQKRKNGIRASLNWYATDELNYNETNSIGNDEESHQQVTKNNFRMTSNIIQPALMCTAGKDGILKPELSHRMENWCTGGLTRKHILEAGHWILQEQPEEVNKILLEWIDKLAPIEENMKQWEVQQKSKL